ncbi:MAG: AAA family ATPase, partial [Gammaproteobacteria bacterium]|nr:AAA family ATPase [Gammaproteobacteria bacterium]
MITELNIRDFAIIEQLNIDFHAGFSVLTGETGAGKSILIDAIGLVLGNRADKSFVRHGAKQAVITARFEINDGSRAWLADHSLIQTEHDTECLLRRVVNNKGQSRAYINDQATTVTLLKALGQQLIDIHGQHAHQSLLQPDTARQLVDAFGDCHVLVNEVRQCYRDLTALKERWQTLSQSTQERAQRLDYLQFQVSELQDFDLNPQSIISLEQESE